MEEKFLKYLQEQRLSENSCNSYLSDLKKFKEYYFYSYDEELGKLTHADVAMYISYLQNHNEKPDTINRKLVSLKHYNLFLREQGIQDNIVIVDRDRIRIQKPMIKKSLPSNQEINKLKHVSSQDEKHPFRDFCFIMIYLYAGLRASEIVSLKLSDLLFEERLINVYGKGNKFRQVIMNNIVYKAIEDYLECERNLLETKNPYLFVSQKNVNNSKPYNRNFGNRLLDKYKEECKIAKLHPHLLRSYFCTNALNNAGYSIVQVANQAGHSSLNTTKGYIVTNEEDLYSLSNKL